jgi:hypothetical protein
VEITNPGGKAMGTRSQTYIHTGDFNSAVLACIYRQFDGYPTGMGNDIAKAIGSRKLVNGYNDAATGTNGMGCAAALLISALKGDKCGNVYIEHPESQRSGCDYYYDLAAVGGAIHIRVTDGDDTLFEGPLSEFDGEKLEAEAA